MNITILTLFPEMFKGPFDLSIIKRAKEKGLLNINFINIRDFGLDRRRTVDDKPYGGGAGMIMRVDVLDKTIEKSKTGTNEKVILLDPKGKKFDQKMAKRFSKLDHLILVCGHYEGIDARVNKLVDEVVSIGDYVLTGGEIPAMIIVDCVTRLIPEVLKKPEATKNESFSDETLLEPPQYTRPEVYRKMRVPKVLLSGNHSEIKKWKETKSKKIN